jgi:hypothetical protein
VSWTATTAQDPPSSEEIFPLAIGNRWTYRINGKEKFVVTALRNEKIGDALCTRLEARGKADGFSSESVAVRNDGLYRYRDEGFDLDPPLKFCKLPLKKGDTWKATYKIGGKTGAIRYEVDTDTVTVPAGSYTAWVIRGEGGEDKNKVKFTSWYVAKVGLVKQSIEDSKMAWMLEIELEKFEPAEIKKDSR